MTGVGVLLYGPPASGKDTVTSELHALASEFRLFPRLKVGPGRTQGYRMATPAQVRELHERGAIIWRNDRYGATYVIDAPELLTRVADHVPVLHLGQPEAIDAIREAMPQVRWLIIQLRCPRDVAAARIRERRTGDDDQRLSAYDATPQLSRHDLDLDTSQATAREAAELIHDRVRQLQRADTAELTS